METTLIFNPDEIVDFDLLTKLWKIPFREFQTLLNVGRLRAFYRIEGDDTWFDQYKYNPYEICFLPKRTINEYGESVISIYYGNQEIYSNDYDNPYIGHEIGFGEIYQLPTFFVLKNDIALLELEHPIYRRQDPFSSLHLFNGEKEQLEKLAVEIDESKKKFQAMFDADFSLLPQTLSKNFCTSLETLAVVLAEGDNLGKLCEAVGRVMPDDVQAVPASYTSGGNVAVSDDQVKALLAKLGKTKVEIWLRLIYALLNDHKGTVAAKILEGNKSGAETAIQQLCLTDKQNLPVTLGDDKIGDIIKALKTYYPM